MRLLPAVLLAVALAACGGSKKKDTTTPTGGPSAGGAPGSGETSMGEPAGQMPGTGTDAPTGGDGTAGGGAGTPKPPEGDDWDDLAPTTADHKPPGADLPPEERARVVKENTDRARQALASNDPDTAINAALKVLDADETDVEAMILLAEGYYRKGYNDKAEYILTLARRQKGAEENPKLWMLLGLVAHRDQDREDDALAAYEKASELKSDYLQAFANKGAIYLKRRRYDDALVAFERAAQLQGNSAMVRTNLGSAYRGKAAASVGNAGQRDDLLRKAEREYKAAINLDANYAPAYFNLGLLYLDAEPFPGLETVPRLESAQRYFAEYKRVAGSTLKKADPVNDYMSLAATNIDREKKRDEAKRKREERDRKRKELEEKKKAEEAKEAKEKPPEDAAGGTEGGTEAPPPPPAEEQPGGQQ